MKMVVDGNTAAAMVAYKLSEVIPIYPITPSSPMAEYCDGEVSKGKPNIFGKIPTLVEMQSEGGAAGALHGSLCSGALSTTFTSSQGLLLMIPNLYKLAGEHLPCVLHIAARAIATHALSIFGDHSDVMAIRQTGAIILSSSSVQQAHDFALISHILSLKASLPVVHFFDGFRTSHELQKIEIISDETIKTMLPEKEISHFKTSGLDSANPYQKGTAQNPDVFFQNRELSARAYLNIYETLQEILKQFESLTGRHYDVFELIGSKKPKNIIVSMGSSCETIAEVLSNKSLSKDTALLNLHLYRPFEYEKLCALLPQSVEKVIVLDRTKECGSREPLYLDVVNSLQSRPNIKVLGGRYGLGGKDFTPSMAKSVIDNFEAEKDNFTVGIVDDVLNSNLPCEDYHTKTDNFQMKFWGLGSDGTVSASKSTIKILGNALDKFVQGYFEYDSKKSGSLTRSHIRVSDTPIKSAYLVENADIVSISNFSFVHRYNCIEGLKKNGTVLINSIFSADEIDKVLPDVYKKTLQEKKAKLFVVNAQKLAESVGLGNKINMIMQTALFKVSNVVHFALAEAEIKKYIEKTFSKKGKDVVKKNLDAVKLTCKNIEKVDTSKFTFKNLSLQEKNIDDKFYMSIFQLVA